MDTRQKPKRQDEARQPAQTPIADAIVIGTAAGGLVLGTMQAQGAVPQSDHLMLGSEASLEPTGQTKDVAATDATSVGDMPAQPADAVTPAENLVQPTVDNATLAIEPAFTPDSMDMPVQDQLVQTLSQHMAGTIEKVIQGAEPGVSAAEFSQSIASDIVQSAQEIVARLDIGSLLSETREFANSALGQIGADTLVAEVLGATSGLTDHVLTDVSTLLGNASLAELPSSLLGNDGADGPDGLLSSLFYSDGASDGLLIPDISSAASSVVADLTGGPTGLLGLSYMDMADHQSGHGINALSLL